MQDIQLDSISIDKLFIPFFGEKKVSVEVVRLDKIHPLISGNKWFKLRYYLQVAKTENKKAMVTYGGAWSNHILATAAACNMNNIRSYGIIRGEEAPELSPTLLQAKELGMQLLFISREDFRIGKIPDELNHTDHYFIPEGGYGIPGAEGAATILDYCQKENYTHICCAAGTGTMTAGLVMGSLFTQQVISISVLKNNFSLEEEIKKLISKPEKTFTLIQEYHFGGYAKYTQELIDFMNKFYRSTSIPSDFVYTGKLFFAMNDLISNNFFSPGSIVLLVHSGGLQGNSSLSKGTLIF